MRPCGCGYDLMIIWSSVSVAQSEVLFETLVWVTVKFHTPLHGRVRGEGVGGGVGEGWGIV